MNMIKKYKWVWIIGIILITAVLFGVNRTQNTNAADEAGNGETAVAFMGDLSESATASGQVVAQREAALSLATSGVVEQLNVAVGDAVAAGDVLVQLETAVLERAVLSAEADVAIAQANLTNLLNGASDAEIAAAESNVFSAQARLDTLIAGPTAEEIAASQASVNAAQANMWASSGKLQATYEVSDSDILSAQATLDAALEQQEAAHNVWIRLADCEENDEGTHSCTPDDSDRMDAATQNVAAANAQVELAQARLDELSSPNSNSVAGSQASLGAATAQYEAAIARHEAFLLPASDADIASAEADLANAQASLDKLLSGATATEITTFETRLAQAETGLQEAQKALADAQLLAPFAGVITAVNLSEGELASGQAIDMVDNSSLEVVLSVDEVDVGNVQVGQAAIVTMETWPTVEIKSAVTAVAPSAVSNNSGIVSYDVHLSLEQDVLPILVGMTANADLITAQREDVLLVPNAVLTADRENGTYTVNLVRTGADGSETVTAVTVTIGLRDNQFTQITSGIVAGDELAIGELSAPVDDGGFGGGPGQ
jgi:HlyD family secretion protein